MTPTTPNSLLAGVDAFGSSKIAAEQIIATANLPLGMPADRDDESFSRAIEAAEKRIQSEHAFAFVKISPIFYFMGSNAGRTFVTIDVVDAGDEARLTFRSAPTGCPEDPANLVEAWRSYESRAWELVGQGALEPGQCRGGFHCGLGFGHAELEPFEARFIAEVPLHVAQLRAVLAEDAVADNRAAAAFLLAYARTRETVVEVLVPSIDDSSGLVRNNVLRVLLMVQEGATTPLVPLDPLLRALRFPLTSDRNKAAYALLALLKHRGPESAAAHRRRVAAEAGELLISMAAMTQPNNRDPAISVLEAISGEKFGADISRWRAWLARRE